MVDTQSMARGAALAGRPRRTPTYRRRRWSDRATGDRTYVGRRRASCQLSRRPTWGETFASIAVVLAAFAVSVVLVLGAFGHSS